MMRTTNLKNSMSWKYFVSSSIADSDRTQAMVKLTWHGAHMQWFKMKILNYLGISKGSLYYLYWVLGKFWSLYIFTSHMKYRTSTRVFQFQRHVKLI
jgi:hypothetical protein